MDLTFIGLVFIIWAFYIIIPTVLLSFLQWFLCGKNLRWGKVLPILSAVASVLFCLVLLLAGLYAVGTGWRLITWGIPFTLILFNIPPWYISSSIAPESAATKKTTSTA